jgi:hypothetical protein
MKSGSLNLPESSGPVQTCNGIALPLPSTISSDNLKEGMGYSLLILPGFILRCLSVTGLVLHNFAVTINHSYPTGMKLIQRFPNCVSRRISSGSASIFLNTEISLYKITE